MKSSLGDPVSCVPWPQCSLVKTPCLGMLGPLQDLSLCRGLITELGLWVTLFELSFGLCRLEKSAPGKEKKGKEKPWRIALLQSFSCPKLLHSLQGLAWDVRISHRASAAAFLQVDLASGLVHELGWGSWVLHRASFFQNTLPQTLIAAEGTNAYLGGFQFTV